MVTRNPLFAAAGWLLCWFIGLSAAAGSLADVATPPQAAASEPVTRKVLVLGDSISAAYGMSLAEGWVALLERQLADSHPRYRVVNASISGETSAGAAARLPALLSQHRPAVVIIELGGNDGLRGYPVKQLRANLQAMVELARAAGARALLLGMEIPPNYGSRYTQAFRDSFARVARETGAALSPFMLDGIATDRALMQADGIHPRPEAQPMLLANVWPQLEPLLE